LQQHTIGVSPKLDEPLFRLVSEGVLHRSSSVPVIIRCDRDALATVCASVVERGGCVRRTIKTISALSAWVPLEFVAELADSGTVIAIELEQGFSVA
jgi:hypothetical protein